MEEQEIGKFSAYNKTWGARRFRIARAWRRGCNAVSEWWRGSGWCILLGLLVALVLLLLVRLGTDCLGAINDTQKEILQAIKSLKAGA